MSPDFDVEWARCSPWIEGALEHCAGTHLLSDVEELLRTDSGVSFWPGKRSAMVSQIIYHPRVVQMHHWLAGGDLSELLDMLPTVEAFGLLRGATLFTLAGRQRHGRCGWGRVLEPFGYAPRWELLTKDIAA